MKDKDLLKNFLRDNPMISEFEAKQMLGISDDATGTITKQNRIIADLLKEGELTGMLRDAAQKGEKFSLPTDKVKEGWSRDDLVKMFKEGVDESSKEHTERIMRNVAEQSAKARPGISMMEMADMGKEFVDDVRPREVDLKKVGFLKELADEGSKVKGPIMNKVDDALRAFGKMPAKQALKMGAKGAALGALGPIASVLMEAFDAPAAGEGSDRVPASVGREPAIEEEAGIGELRQQDEEMQKKLEALSRMK